MNEAFAYWKESDGRHLGYLNDYPDHWTQGEDLEDLKEQLRGLYSTFGAEQIPGSRRVEELEVVTALQCVGFRVRRQHGSHIWSLDQRNNAASSV